MMEPGHSGRFAQGAIHHRCLIYETGDEHATTIHSFIRTGFERQEQSLYLTDRSPSIVRSLLEREGIDFDSKVESGALRVLHPRDVVLKKGRRSADALFRFLTDAAEEARTVGFTSLRVLHDISWVDRTGDETPLREYEMGLNLLRPPFLIACLYDRNHLPPEKIKEAIRSHPEIIYGGLICENPYYFPPEMLDGTASAEDEINSLLGRLLSRQKNKKILQDLNRRLEQEIMERKKAEQLLATEHAATRFLAESSQLSDAALGLVQLICETLGWEQGAFWCLDEENEIMRCTEIWNMPSLSFPRFQAAIQSMRILPDEELPGRAWTGRVPAWVNDFAQESYFFRAPIAAMEGLHGACAFPIWSGREIFGVMEFFSREARPIDDDQLLVMANIGSQMGQFIERKRAEQAVREGEARKEAILESAFDGMIVVDGRGKIIEFNSAAEKTFGYLREEVIGKKMMEIILPPARRPRHSRGIKRYLTNEKRIEITAMRSDGSEFPLELAVTRIPVEGPPLFAASLRDLSEKKQAEERYRLLVEGVKDYAILMLDPNGKIVSWNGGAERIYGYPVEEILGKDFSYFYSFEEIQRGKPAADLRGAATEGQFEDERWHIRKEGSRFWAHSVITRLTDPRGTLIGFSKITRDLSERKRVEDALAAEKERLAVTLRSIGDGVITTDIEGKIVLMNNVAEALTGWTQEEAIGKPLDEVFRIINPETGVRRESPIQNILNEGSVVEVSHQTALLTKDRIERNIADSGAPIRDEEGKIIGVVLVFRDVTEKLKVEAERFKASKMESVGLFAGGIAHDFNNILTAILGNISLARLYVDQPESLLERLAQAEKASLRAKDLSQQLLTFAKGGAPVKKIASMVDLLNEAGHFASSGSNARCDFFIDDGLWPVEIDEGQISQVIHNILINARQAMPGGGIIQVRASNLPAESVMKKEFPMPAQDYVEVAIRDQGVGIPKENLSKIFDPYFTTKEGGNGLGLSTVYSILKNHGGHIHVISEVGAGSTFFFYLPASREAAPLEEKKEEGLLTGRGTILLVDDDAGIRDVAGEMLREIGYEVVFAEEGKEAILLYRERLLSGRAFDAVVMDLTIAGGMGGKETIEELLSIDPHIKAIVSSGYSDDPIMADFRRFGFSGVAAKPYKIEELSRTLRAVLGPEEKSRPNQERLK